MTTNVPVQLISPLGSASGQTIISGGPNTPAGWGSLDASGATFTQAGAGAVSRTVQAELRDKVSVKQFGAKGDGVTNDTAAFSAAFAACAAASGKTLLVPSGTYLVDALTYPSYPYAQQFSIIGDGPVSTILKKRAVDSNPLLTIGASNATNFTSDIVVSGIQFNGGAAGSGTPAAVQTYDLVRSTFDNCHFNGAQAGVYSYGGITNTFVRCRFYSNVFGVRFDKFTSSAGGGYPNFNTLRNSVITLNTTTGVTIDNGRGLLLDSCDIEGNGTAGANTGGVYVGPSMGSEISSTSSYGVTIRNGYFENNSGVAHVRFDSARNTIRDTYLLQAGGSNTYDIYPTGGFYTLENVTCDTSLSANLMEGGSVGTGNAVINCAIPNMTYNAAKTSVTSGTTHTMRSGVVPVVLSSAAPMIQTGSASPTSSGTITVTFPTAYKSGTVPFVVVQVNNNSPTTVDSIEVYSISSTGFIARAKEMTNASTTVTNPNLSFQWLSVGTTL